MKTAKYFESIKLRPDRVLIKDEWILKDIANPEKSEVQDEGRIRKWVKIDASEGKYLRIILLEDNETVHNVFFDRGFKP